VCEREVLDNFVRRIISLADTLLVYADVFLVSRWTVRAEWFAGSHSYRIFEQCGRGADVKQRPFGQNRTNGWRFLRRCETTVLAPSLLEGREPA
jgi:hypothetical protein